MKKYFFFLLLAVFTIAAGKAQQPPAASDVLKEAYATAAKEHKKVMIIFHASWCGWCRKMDSSLNDASVKDFFDKNYVIRHLTILESKGKEALESPGALELNKKWGGENQGLPYWVVLDKNGKILGDSQRIPSENVGCPAQPEEVAHFITVLKKSSSIADAQVSLVEKRFLKNG